MGAAIVGFVLGRRSEALLARFVSPAEQAQGDKLLHQWGTLAILVTRPVPLLGETVMIMAGASTLRWKPVMLAALAGSLPRALLYALAGTVSTSFQHSSLVFGSMLLLAGVFWGMSKLIRVRLSDRIS
jgi:membrane protein DedA with SNARE-associated domain